MSFSKALEVPHKLFKIYPYILFVGFFFFEIRMILLHMSIYPVKGQILLSAILLPFIILSLWKSFWLLVSLAVAVPLFSGMQAYGYWAHVQIPSLYFGIIFVFWMPKRILIQKEGLVPKSTTGFWIDIFSGIIFLSLLVSLSRFPLEVILYQFWFFPILSQADPMYCIDAAFILLQGLFWFRMLELENPFGIVRGKLVLILFIHIWIILFFQWLNFCCIFQLRFIILVFFLLLMIFIRMGVTWHFCFLSPQVFSWLPRRKDVIISFFVLPPSYSSFFLSCRILG